MHNRLPAYLPTSLLPRGVVAYRFRSRRLHLIQSEGKRTVAFCGRDVYRVSVDLGRRVGCTDCVRAARELGYDV